MLQDYSMILREALAVDQNTPPLARPEYSGKFSVANPFPFGAPLPNRSVSYANLNCKTCNDLATQYNAYGPVTEQNIEAFAAYANA